MIYENKNMRGSVKNKGKVKRAKLVISQFAWLLENDKKAVVEAYRDAGFEVDEDVSPKKLVSILRKALFKAREQKRNTKVNDLITNISVLILLNEKEKKEFSNFFKASGSDSWYAKEADKASGSQEKGKFVKENADTIGKIGASFVGALFSRGGNDQLDDSISSHTPSAPPKKSNTGLIIGLGVGALAVIGLTVFLVRKNKK